MIFGITKGSSTLPDLDNGTWNPVSESDFIEKTDGNKSYIKVSDNRVLRAEGPKSFDMTFTLSERTEVTVGFVANISLDYRNQKGGNVEVTEIAIERK